MINKVEMYQAVCDGCGKKDGAVFIKRDTAVRYVVEQRGWYKDGNKLYCPDCVEWDEENKCYKPKEKKQL